MRKILITGASGFIGVNLTKRLVERDFEVHVLVRSMENLSRFDAVINNIHVHHYTGDMESMMAIFGAAQPQAVIHLAALFLAEHEPKDVTSLINSNILLGGHLLEAMSAHGVRCLVNTGTHWQYYSGASYNPTSLYAATKKAFEDIANYYVQAHGLKMLTLIIYDTYGPMDKRPKLFSLLNRVKETSEELKMSPGDQLIGLVHIDDVIDAYVTAINTLSQSSVPLQESFFLTPCAFLKLRDVVMKYEEVNCCKLNILWGARPYRAREIMDPYIGHRLPGWTPRITLEQGLREM